MSSSFYINAERRNIIRGRFLLFSERDTWSPRQTVVQNKRLSVEKLRHRKLKILRFLIQT